MATPEPPGKVTMAAEIRDLWIAFASARKGTIIGVLGFIGGVFLVGWEFSSFYHERYARHPHLRKLDYWENSGPSAKALAIARRPIFSDEGPGIDYPCLEKALRDDDLADVEKAVLVTQLIDLNEASVTCSTSQAKECSSVWSQRTLELKSSLQQHYRHCN